MSRLRAGGIPVTDYINLDLIISRPLFGLLSQGEHYFGVAIYFNSQCVKCIQTFILNETWKFSFGNQSFNLKSNND